jgi:NAD(P)-dependent dehydrogenase (short-subunit alcohol dehydrogenase family)
VVKARTHRWVIAAAIAALILGAILSHVIDPGIRVEKVMLTANSLPAYQLSKRGNSLRVMAEAVRWGKRGARVNTISPALSSRLSPGMS